MRLQQYLHLLGATLLAAFGATIALVIPLCVQIEDSINIVVVKQVLTLTMTTFMVATTHAMLFGLPLYLFVRRRRPRVGIAACALAGFLIAAAPFSVLALIGGGAPAMVNRFNGAPTPFSWIEYVSAVALLGSAGLVGGLTFWAAMRLSIPSRRSWGVVSAGRPSDGRRVHPADRRKGHKLPQRLQRRPHVRQTASLCKFEGACSRLEETRANIH